MILTLHYITFQMAAPWKARVLHPSTWQTDSIGSPPLRIAGVKILPTNYPHCVALRISWHPTLKGRMLFHLLQDRSLVLWRSWGRGWGAEVVEDGTSLVALESFEHPMCSSPTERASLLKGAPRPFEKWFGPFDELIKVCPQVSRLV